MPNSNLLLLRNMTLNILVTSVVIVDYSLLFACVQSRRGQRAPVGQGHDTGDLLDAVATDWLSVGSSVIAGSEQISLIIKFGFTLHNASKWSVTCFKFSRINSNPCKEALYSHHLLY